MNFTPINVRPNEANGLIHNSINFTPINVRSNEANGLIHTSPGQRPGCEVHQNPAA